MSIVKTMALFSLTLVSHTVFAGGCCSVPRTQCAEHSMPKNYCAACNQEIAPDKFAITAAEICAMPQHNRHFHLTCFFKLRTKQADKLAELCGAAPLKVGEVIARIDEHSKNDLHLQLKAAALLAMALEWERDMFAKALGQPRNQAIS